RLTIGPWSGSLGEALPDIAVVTPEQLEEIRYYCEAEELRPPQHLYYVVPNAVQHLQIICFAIKYLHFETAQVCNVSGELSQFFKYWDRLVRGDNASCFCSDTFNLPEQLRHFDSSVRETVDFAREL